MTAQEQTFSNYEAGDTLPNGASIVDVDNLNGYVLAINKGAVQPFVVWDIMPNGEAYNGRYNQFLSDALITFNELTGND